jgi:hypothetical protein
MGEVNYITVDIQWPVILIVIAADLIIASIHSPPESVLYLPVS